MSFRINSNIASLSAQRHLGNAQKTTQKALRALASGSRVSNPGDDAAGFAISERLRGQLSGINQAKLNSQSAVSLIQTAEGSLNEQNNILIRMRELAVQSASDTVGKQERGYLNTEFTQLIEEFDRIAKVSRYGDKQLLTGTNERFEFHVGPFNGPENIIKFDLNANTTAYETEIDDLNVTQKDDALDSIESIDGALSKVLEARSTFGAAQSRFQYAMGNLEIQKVNITEAHSLIADADIAESVTNLTKGQLLQEFGAAVLSQANSDKSVAMRLLS